MFFGIMILIFVGAYTYAGIMAFTGNFGVVTRVLIGAPVLFVTGWALGTAFRATISEIG